MKPYLIYSPKYYIGFNGVRVLHRLVHLLNEKGCLAYTLVENNPLWNEKTIDLKEFEDNKSNFIGVYPEIVFGNPLEVSRVVRWVLNTPGLLDGDTEYDKNELLFTWSKDYINVPNLLKVNTIEYDLFTKGTNDEYDCFYVHKGHTKPRLKELEGLREITDTWPETRQDLADFLKKTRILYTYDNNTQLIYEAMLCGCRVIVVPEKIELDKDLYHKRYIEYNKLHESQLDNFIKLTQEM